MKSNISDVTRLIHNHVAYPAVDGIVDVPTDVLNHNVAFPHWDVVKEEVSDEIKAKLAEAANAGEPEGDAEPPADGEPSTEPTVAELREKAKELGITGYGNLKKAELIAAIEEAGQQSDNE